MKIDVLLQGFPGTVTRGYMSWSSVVYVESGERKILFDTGGMGERTRIPNIFKARGLSMDDIDTLVLSHFHYDHVMNYGMFPNARILLHEREAAWVLSDPDDWPVPQYLFPAVEKTGRLELIAEDEEIAPGVATLLSPGHTPGCISLVLRDAGTVTVLAGDAVKNIIELASGEVAMSRDNAVSARTIRKIRDIADIVIPGHDRTLKITPDEIVALTVLHEVITVPAGVADAGKPAEFDLFIPPTSLKIR